jgi:hypothetical protein
MISLLFFRSTIIYRQTAHLLRKRRFKWSKPLSPRWQRTKLLPGSNTLSRSVSVNWSIVTLALVDLQSLRVMKTTRCESVYIYIGPDYCESPMLTVSAETQGVIDDRFCN